MVKAQLLQEGVELEEYGGDVQCVETAARAGQGLSELEEALLLQVGYTMFGRRKFCRLQLCVCGGVPSV